MENLVRSIRVAREAVMRTRGRIIAEAFLTMRSIGSPLPRGLIARVLPGLRKKLPFEASKVGLPVDSGKEGRVTRCSYSDGKNISRMDRNLVLHRHPRNPSDERGNEPSQTYRQNLPQHADVTYTELENHIRLSTERASLRLPLDMGRSPRSSQRLGKLTTRRRRAVGNNAVHCELSWRKDV
jgi:hypothetical protein